MTREEIEARLRVLDGRIAYAQLPGATTLQAVRELFSLVRGLLDEVARLEKCKEDAIHFSALLTLKDQELARLRAVAEARLVILQELIASNPHGSNHKKAAEALAALDREKS